MGYHKPVVKLTKISAAVLLALLLPACGKKGPQESVPPWLGGPATNSDLITVDVQNNDLTSYDLAIREFTSGTLSAEVRIAWPIGGAAGGLPSHAEGNWDFHPDSSTYTHSVILYSVVGTPLDEQPFVKGAPQLLLVVTITASKMSVSP